MNLCALAGQLWTDDVLGDGIDEDQTVDEQTYARQVIPDQEEIDAYGHEDDRRSYHGQ